MQPLPLKAPGSIDEITNKCLTLFIISCDNDAIRVECYDNIEKGHLDGQ